VLRKEYLKGNNVNLEKQQLSLQNRKRRKSMKKYNKANGQQLL
jgi:hypothetical protein